MVSPMITSPPIRNSPNAPITPPAASGPSCPWVRIRRVEARLRPRRSIVATSRIVGKALSSSGFSMNRAVIRIITDTVIDSASPRSSSQPGIGRISIAMIATTPPASAMSRFRPSLFRKFRIAGGIRFGP